MGGNGQLRAASTDSRVLHWPGRVVTADDLRRTLDGHRELVLPARAIITPLADEQLRANGIRVTRQPGGEQPAWSARWGYAQDRLHSLVQSAVQALARDGVVLKELRPKDANSSSRWAWAVAECVASGECQGGVVFCEDAGLICCVVNKVAGLRAVPVASVAQAARATLTLGANLVAVEMPGRTYFEIRQIFRTLCLPGNIACPPGVACTLQELDGHAHR
jgi:ribose 5-phosphate isomerase RpiB